jgi:hypothetical protein
VFSTNGLTKNEDVTENGRINKFEPVVSVFTHTVASVINHPFLRTILMLLPLDTILRDRRRAGSAALSQMNLLRWGL